MTVQEWGHVTPPRIFAEEFTGRTTCLPLPKRIDEVELLPAAIGTGIVAIRMEAREEFVDRHCGTEPVNGHHRRGIHGNPADVSVLPQTE